MRFVGSTLEGWAAGEVTHGPLRMWIGSRDGSFKARASARLDRGAVLGRIDGEVSMNGGACTNNGHTWTLQSR